MKIGISPSGWLAIAETNAGLSCSLSDFLNQNIAVFIEK